MKDGSEHSVIKGLADLIFSLQSFHDRVIELGRTGQIVLHGSSRQDCFLYLHYILLSLDHRHHFAKAHDTELHDISVHRNPEMVFQLLYEPALLP